MPIARPLHYALIFPPLIVILVVAALFLPGRSGEKPELAYLASHPQATFAELSAYLGEVAKSKGALYAFDILREGALPPNTDTHLLGHVVGDELYRQQGAEGIASCTQEFRNACSHAIVIGVLTDEGVAGLVTIADVCQRAPGGPGAYTMCFHGLGHGVFAYTGYDLPATISLCRKTATPAHQDREYVECVGGAIMELVGGGAHDHDQWLAARRTYLSADDPLYPCDAPLVPAELKPICYTYLTPHLFEAGGGDLGHPGPEEFTRAFASCDRIPAAEGVNRDACFGGIGKELPTLAASRDIRSLDQLNQDALLKVRGWCALAPHAQAHEQCARAVADSLFWGGENDPHAAVSFCKILATVRAACFDELFFSARSFYRDDALRSRLCALMPEDLREACREALLPASTP